jgi:type I restriction enzyme, S subunit
MVQLGELVKIAGGGTPSRNRPEFFNGGIPWVTVKDFNDDFFIHRSQENISQLGLDKSASRLIPAGNIILGTRMSVGKAAINLIDVAINQDLKALFCSPRINTRYLTFFLAAVAPRLEEQATGATVKGITIDDIEGLEVPLPDLSEQRRIAQELERADGLRRTLRYALELAETFLPAAFLQFFGSTGNEFPISTVEDLLADKRNAIRTGPFGSQLLHSEFTDGGIAVLGIDNAVNNSFEWSQRRYITLEKYEQLKRYTVFPGDVIITLMGTCGRCAIVPDGIPTAINTKHLCCITLDQSRCLPIFLQGAFLYHPFVRRQLSMKTKGSIMEGLNMGIIQDLRIPLPPLPLQTRFAELVSRHERLRSVQRESLRQSEHLFQSLLNRAFS